jgi:hypothetical protein
LHVLLAHSSGLALVDLHRVRQDFLAGKRGQAVAAVLRASLDNPTAGPGEIQHLVGQRSIDMGFST